MRRWGSLFILLLVVPANPSLADSEIAPPLFIGPGFVLLEVDAVVQDPHVILDISTNGSALSFASIFQERTSVGTSIILHSSGGKTGGEAKVADVNTSATVRPHGNGGWISGVWPPPGKSHVLIVATGAIMNWTFEVEPATTKWAIVQSGPSHSAVARDGEGTWLVAKAESTAGYAVVGARYQIPVEHRLFGIFFSERPIGTALGAVLVGPEGTRECPCMLVGNTIDGPGEYEFEWTGAGIDISQSPIIAWADVPGI